MNGHIAAGNEFHVGILPFELNHECTGFGVDLVVDEIHLEFSLVGFSVRADDLHAFGGEGSVAAVFKEIGFAHGEADLNRIELDDGGKGSFFRCDVIAFAVYVASDPPVEWGINFRVGEIVLGENQIGARLVQFSFVDLIGADGVFVGGLCRCAGFVEGFVTFLFPGGVVEFRERLLEGCLGDVDVFLVDGVFDLEEQIAIRISILSSPGCPPGRRIST